MCSLKQGVFLLDYTCRARWPERLLHRRVSKPSQGFLIRTPLIIKKLVTLGQISKQIVQNLGIWSFLIAPAPCHSPFFQQGAGLLEIPVIRFFRLLPTDTNLKPLWSCTPKELRRQCFFDVWTSKFDVQILGSRFLDVHILAGRSKSFSFQRYTRISPLNLKVKGRPSRRFSLISCKKFRCADFPPGK